MRIAWLLGVFLFSPPAGHGALRDSGLPAAAPAALLGGLPSEFPFSHASGFPTIVDTDPALPGYAHLTPVSPPAPKRLRPLHAQRQTVRPRNDFFITPGPAEPLVPMPSPSAPGDEADHDWMLDSAFSQRLDPPPPFEVLEDDLRDAVASPPLSLARFQQAQLNLDAKKRRQAVEAFGRPDNIAAIPHLGAVFLRLNEDVSVRVAAAAALGRIGRRRAWTYLAQSVADPNAKVRFAAVMALGQLDGYGDAHLDKVIAQDPAWYVRYAAALAMGRARKPWSAAWLKRAACKDAAWQVRFQAALALGELGTPRATAALARPLRDPEPMVRAAAALALGRCAGARGAALLAQTLHRERDDGVRAVLSWALQKTQGSGS